MKTKATLSPDLMLPEDHPLMILDKVSDQFKSCLIDYYAEAIRKAEEAAKAAGVNEEDGGSCNFDQVMIDFTGWKTTDIEAISGKGSRDISDKYSSRFWKGCCAIDFTQFGQGSRRTRMAEAAHKVLKAAGLPSHMYYQMD